MKHHVSLLLRLAVAFAFLYPPISAVFSPYAWVGYFPSFILSAPIDSLVILHIFGGIEVVLGLWILSGKKIFWPSTVAAVMLAGIVIFNFSQMDVLFRDISIALAAVALALMAKAERPEASTHQTGPTIGPA